MAIQAYSFMAYAWTLRRGVPGKYWAVFIGQKAARWLAPVACFVALLSLCWFWPAVGLALSLTLASPVFFVWLPGGARLFGSAFFLLTAISAYIFGFICFSVWKARSRLEFKRAAALVFLHRLRPVLVMKFSS